MARPKKKRDFKAEWREIDLSSLRDEKITQKFEKMYRMARSVQDQRTRGHEFFSKVSHMQNLYQPAKMKEQAWSEGSTQAIKRKIRAETIQRVPDGEIKTQFDKNSVEQIEINYIFKNKILKSEFDGMDMLKNLWNTFNSAYDYGYGCVKTCFEEDCDGDVRIKYKHIHWNDILPAPDCQSIESAEWYLVRSWVSRSELKKLVDWETGEVKNKDYNADVVKYLIANEIIEGKEPRSMPLADKRNGAFPIESFEIRTLYKRGCDKFVSFVPLLDCVLCEVDNEDPRKDVPIHFMILEPDPEFPLGMSSILPTLGQQQFADAFQTTTYQTLLLAINPPLMGFGNLTPAKFKMKPRAYWPMGTNPNNKVEKFPVETTSITQYGSILNNVSGRMQANMNITEQTLATDSQVSGYSATPQGVDKQKQDKSTTINQYQKRVEIFFSEWCNHALRSYLHSMSGMQEMTVDEDTRRKIWDVESSQKPKDENGEFVDDESIIVGNKIKVNFDELNGDLLEFEVRAGSLVQGEREKEQQNIQQMLIPVSQMLGNLSDEHKKPFEESIMKMVSRLLELSDIDISVTTSSKINETLLQDALKATMDMVAQQQGQIDQMAGQMGQMMPPMPEGEGQPPMPGMPPEGEPPMSPEGEPPMPGGKGPAGPPPMMAVG